MTTDPLRVLIDAVRAARPGTDIDFGPPLSGGEPVVRCRRVPGSPHPSLSVTYYVYEHGEGYSLSGHQYEGPSFSSLSGLLDLREAVDAVARLCDCAPPEESTP